MRAGGASNIGEVHLEFGQPNQDNFLINEEQNIFAVFDGHGDQGHVIANYLKENLASTFTSALTHSSSPSVEDSLKNAFQTLDQNICRENTSESSGSTCVMAYVRDNNLYVAGVGDCSAFLVHASSGKVETTSLATAHKLTNKTEHNRITEVGASVTGEYVISKTDPDKIINMTRSFGDQDMKPSGIISIPEISITPLSPSSSGSERASKKIKTDSTEPTTNNRTIEENKNATNTESKTDNNENTNTDSPTGTFIILFSDGLDQVQSTEEIAKHAYKLLSDNFAEKKDAQVPLSTLCTTLLHTLEDKVEERDTVGFSDDATIVLVLLSGF